MALLKPETRITRILEEARLLTPLQVAGGERSALTLSNITQNLDELSAPPRGMTTLPAWSFVGTKVSTRHESSFKARSALHF